MINTIFFFLLLIEKIISKSISFTIYNNKLLHFVQLEFHIGTPSIRNSFNIDTINEYPIIETPYLNTSVFPSKGGYKYSESPQQISTQLTGILINETVIINDISLDNYQYVLVSNKSDSYYSKIPQYESYVLLSNSNHSLLTFLYEHKAISKRMMQFSNDKLIIGDYLDSINVHCMIYVKLVAKDFYWSVPFTSMRYGTNFKYIFHEGRIVFDMNEANIIAPYHYFSSFEEDYFIYECDSFNDLNDRLFRPKNNIYSYRSLEFLLDEKVVLLFKPEDLFYRHGEFTIFRVKFRKDITHWIIGYNFIEQFNLVINQEENRIEIDSRNNNIRYFEDSSHYCYLSKKRRVVRFISMILLYSLLSFGVISILVIKYKKIYYL